MKTLPALQTCLILAWATTATAYSPLIKASRSSLPEFPAISVAIKGEKEGQLELVVTVTGKKIEQDKKTGTTTPDNLVRHKVDDDKQRAERHFRDLNAVRLLVLDGKKSRKPITLWGPAEIWTYDELAEKFPDLIVDRLPREGTLQIPRESLRKAVVHFDCRNGGLLGPTYQVNLVEYLDESAQKYVAEEGLEGLLEAARTRTD